MPKWASRMCCKRKVFSMLRDTLLVASHGFMFKPVFEALARAVKLLVGGTLEEALDDRGSGEGALRRPISCGSLCRVTSHTARSCLQNQFIPAGLPLTYTEAAVHWGS